MIRDFHQYLASINESRILSALGLTKKSEPLPPQRSPQDMAAQEEADYQAEMARFKKMIEDYAKDGKITRDDLIAVMTDKRYTRHPLNSLVNHILPDTDYMDAAKDPGAKRQYDKEVQLLIQHALQWFDAIHAPPPNDFDWEKTKSLATRRARDFQNRQTKRTGEQNVLPGPWAGVRSTEEEVPGSKKTRRPRKKRNN